MVSVLIFTSIDFRNLSHTHKPLTRITALSSLHCVGTTHTDAPRSQSRRDRNCADRRRSRSRSTLRAIAIAPIGVDRDHRNQRDCDRDLADLARSVDCRFARSRSRSRRSRSRRSRSRRTRSLRSRSRSHREHNLSFWVFSPRN